MSTPAREHAAPLARNRSRPASRPSYVDAWSRSRLHLPCRLSSAAASFRSWLEREQLQHSRFGADFGVVTAPLVVFRLALFPDRSLDGRRVPHGIGATGPRAPELGVVELYRSIDVDGLESSRGHRHRSRSADSAVDED